MTMNQGLLQVTSHKSHIQVNANRCDVYILPTQLAFQHQQHNMGFYVLTQLIGPIDNQ